MGWRAGLDPGSEEGEEGGPSWGAVGRVPQVHTLGRLPGASEVDRQTDRLLQRAGQAHQAPSQASVLVTSWWLLLVCRQGSKVTFYWVK